ncbi:MAG: thioredoxin family protein [Actinomycetota bacterium]|nr:thioredoxin family protein [Actinomycetota bacterium]
MDVTLLYFDGCPNWQTAAARLTALADELDLTVTRRQITTPEQAEEVGFRGSPTVLVDGRDVFAVGHEPVGLSCRVYETPDGSAGAPTLEQLRAVLA